MNGIINILKPTGMTSHDVVSRVRRIIGQKKVGHTGTLDPNAAGVLPICMGRATRVSQFLLEGNKKYRVELTLGAHTDTYDSFGKVLYRKDTSNLKREEIIKAVESFEGEQTQVPPIYSALKLNGKKLYELARSGVKDLDIKERHINVHKISIISVEDEKVMFDVGCSKGTYIRSICNDIGEKLGCGGYMSFLLRTGSGPFEIENAVTLEELEYSKESGNIDELVLGADFALLDYSKIEINNGALKPFVNGAVIYSKGIIKTESAYSNGEVVRVYCDSKFYGLANINISDENGLTLKCHKLLA